jgi:hypothetical protein
MESKGEAVRKIQTDFAEVVNVVDRLNGEAAQENQTSNEFITCFYQFVSRFFFTNSSQFEQLKKKTYFLLVKKQVSFSSVCQLIMKS